MITIIWIDPKLSMKSLKKILSRFLKKQRFQISHLRMIFAIAENQIVPKSTVTAIEEEKSVVANATARIAIIAQVIRICKRILTQNQKRRPNTSDLFIFFI